MLTNTLPNQAQKLVSISSYYEKHESEKGGSMKIAMICAVILAAATAGAATNSNHFYDRSTGVTVVALLTSTDVSGAQTATTQPVTNFDKTPPPLSPAEERALVEGKIQQLQVELNALLIPKEGETADEAALRQQDILRKQRRINKLKSLLLQLPVQSIELN
jgi:hypothetical protein